MELAASSSSTIPLQMQAGYEEPHDFIREEDPLHMQNGAIASGAALSQHMAEAAAYSQTETHITSLAHAPMAARGTERKRRFLHRAYHEVSDRRGPAATARPGLPPPDLAPRLRLRDQASTSSLPDFSHHASKKGIPWGGVTSWGGNRIGTPPVQHRREIKVATQLEGLRRRRILEERMWQELASEASQHLGAQQAQEL